ncbi:MAG: motif [Acidobacteriota bacterium]|nr:motif [Acidobacteriota bacterium]
MKKVFTTVALCAVALVCLGLTAQSAYADGIVFVGPSTLHPDGVGLRTVLSLQSPGSTSTESGGIKFTGSGDQTFGNATRGGTNNTVSLADLGITQNNTAVQIGFNINEPGSGPGSTPVTVTSLILRAYDSNGNVVFTANMIDGPHTLGLLGNGQGTADYLFSLDAAAAARLAAVYNPNLRLGLEATITNAQGGPESFYLGLGKASTPVPEPATMFLLGTGLAGVAARMRKKRKAAKE